MANELENMLNEGFTGIPNALLDHYADVGLNNDDLAVVLQISKAESKLVKNLNMESLAKKLHISEYVAKQRVQRLLQNNWLTIQGFGADNEYFDISPLYKKVANKDFVKYRYMEDSNSQKQAQQELISYVEQKFSRPLNTNEVQLIINQWLYQEKYTFDQIKLAMDEALVQNIKNLKYIEAILRNWKENGLETKEDIQKAQIRYRDEKYQQAKKVQEMAKTSENIAVPKINFKDINLSLLEKLKAGNKE